MRSTSSSCKLSCNKSICERTNVQFIIVMDLLLVVVVDLQVTTRYWYLVMVEPWCYQLPLSRKQLTDIKKKSEAMGGGLTGRPLGPTNYVRERSTYSVSTKMHYFLLYDIWRSLVGLAICKVFCDWPSKYLCVICIILSCLSNGPPLGAALSTLQHMPIDIHSHKTFINSWQNEIGLYVVVVVYSSTT